jgi:hypothetical protein
MNGISSTLKDEIKKSGDRKHKEKLKFIVAILVTNVAVALLCLPMGEQKKNTIRAASKTLHNNHQMMLIPLTALITEANLSSTETPVELISKDKKLIITKAWLHEMEKLENGITQFKIEIRNQDVIKVSEYVEAGMIAIPYVEIQKHEASLKKGSKYEVSI